MREEMSWNLLLEEVICWHGFSHSDVDEEWSMGQENNCGKFDIIFENNCLKIWRLQKKSLSLQREKQRNMERSGTRR